VCKKPNKVKNINTKNKKINEIFLKNMEKIAKKNNFYEGFVPLSKTLSLKV
jgi:hypothetical protein